ncbi:MAG: RluA family pseudouridine synthase [Muribaculaceae bacterium]|nr:RluA family pseudouridine synthase [Muribaculaceae bacterium]
MARKPLAAKPGSNGPRLKPDVILDFTVTAADTAAATKAEEGLGLLEFLFARMPDRKRTTVKDYLKHNQVMVNGSVTTAFNRPLAEGDTVSVNTSREFQTFSNPRLKIIYEDEDIIVVNKGYGLLSMGTDKKKDGTAYSLLRDYLKRKDPRNKLFIVHRLDQGTSGLMMFAKTAEAKDTMQHNWNNMVLERKYIAIVNGVLEPEEGIIRSYLAENAAHEVYSTPDPSKGQLAVTSYKTLKKRGPYSMVELSLSTGRKNQIRVHMKEAGHTIVGDRRYGAEASPIHRLALHAQTLRFVHPVTRRDMNFKSELPAGFSKLV